MRRPLDVELKIEKEISPWLSGSGYELVGIQVSVQAHTSTVRIYLDKIEGGITIDDIAIASRKISACLDAQGMISGAYTLEVSSPGLDRPLLKPAHFFKQIGRQIRISLAYPKDNQRNFQGILHSVEGDVISLLIEATDQKQSVQKMETFSFEQIDKAKLIPDIKIGTAGKGKKGGVKKE